jgi:sec-independent protein translocase protein TatB
VFNLQGGEIIIVLLLALVVLGPEKLPDAMRRLGQTVSELKKMSAGFQSEFKAAVDEPLRELRDTADVLRDSADFTKLQAGERDEKPKSAEMAPVDADQVPTEDVPTFETPASTAPSPEPAADSKPAPFDDGDASAPSGEPEADDAPGPGTTDEPERPAVFPGMVVVPIDRGGQSDEDTDDGSGPAGDAGGEPDASDAGADTT